MQRLLVFLFLVIGSFDALSQYYGIEKLNPAINTRDYNEISPKVSPDGKTLFFTRIGYPIYDQTLLINGVNWGGGPQFSSKLRSIFYALGGSGSTNPEKSDFNQDIWMASHDAGTFDKLSHPGYPLNNALPNSVCAFSVDGQSIYVINQFGYDGGMQPGFSISRKQGDLRWAFPSPLEISDFYTKSAGLHLSMSEDESIVVMSLMRDDSRGGTDLYVSFKKAPGLYSVPVNLGPDINTEHNEEAPFICSDNKTLYFSSDRPGVYGGKDIYKAVRLDLTWEVWDEPFALYEPINSSKDDNQPFYHPGSEYLYFVSNRLVSSDIYRVNYLETLLEKDPDNTIYASIDPIQDFKPSVDDLTYAVRIKTINAANGKAIDANIDYTGFGKSSSTQTKSGTATIQYDGRNLLLEISQEGFIAKQVVVDSGSENYELTVSLDPLVENGKIETDPIFFLQSKSAIRKDSYRAIDKLVQTLNRHWNISIIVEGHTDDQGMEGALLLLSQERARAVRDYLVKKGIQPLRIKFVGVGGKKPLNDNSTEELRRQNRRVEIIISKIFPRNSPN